MNDLDRHRAQCKTQQSLKTTKLKKKNSAGYYKKIIGIIFKIVIRR